MTTGMIMNDSSPMPFGKYKGEKLANVPASYLLWLLTEDLKPGPLRTYIEENEDALQKEVQK